MAILDNNYEENSFVIETPSLNYDNVNDKWVGYSGLISHRVKLPDYISVKNSGDLHLPHVRNISQSPFTDNPNLIHMFGIHTYNKAFGFKDVMVVPQVYNYPCLDEVGDNVGKTFSYNGILQGYQVNGISEELVKITCGSKDVTCSTINEDILENPLTKRILCSKSEDDVTYGAYQIKKIYYYIPTKSRFGNDITYIYAESSKVKFKKLVNESNENDNIDTGDNTSTVDGFGVATLPTYVTISPQDVTTNDIIVEYDWFSRCPIGESYVRIDDETTINVYNENGMVMYIKTSDGGYEKKENLSLYQYIELDDESGNLVVSDGYGVDVEEEIDMYLTLPNNVEYDVVNNIFTVNNSDEQAFNEIVLYQPDGGTLQCTEYRWEDVETEYTQSFDYYDLQLTYYNWYIGGVEYKIIPLNDVGVVTKTYTATIDEEEIKWITKEFNLYQYATAILNDSDENYKVKNKDTNYEADYDDGYVKKFRVCAGLSPTDGNWYFYSKNNNGDIVLFKFGSKQIGTTTENGVNYRFKNGKYQVYQEYTRNVVPEINNGECYIRLLNGDTVKVTDNSGNDGFTTADGYKYWISGYNDNILNTDPTNNLPYPLDKQSNIFKLFETTEWANKLLPTALSVGNADDNNKKNFILNSDTSTVFMVGKYKIENEPLHIVYSPKYDLRKPDIIFVEQNDNSETLIKFKIKPFFKKDEDTFEVLPYLKFYDFSWRCTMEIKVTQNNETVTTEVSDSGILTPSDLKIEVIDNDNNEEYYEITITVKGEIQNNKSVWEITDVSGLTLTNIVVTHTNNNNTNV